MSGLDAVVARVRVYLAYQEYAGEAPDFIPFNDIADLLSAYESAVRERDAWMQRATDEQDAHALTASTLAKNVRDLDKLEKYRVERDRARAERVEVTAAMVEAGARELQQWFGPTRNAEDIAHSILTAARGAR